MGRRPRRGEKAREGGGEGRSTNSFILCFLPSPSASFILGFAGPLTPPPLCYRTEAMLTAGDPGPSLLGGLSALPTWCSPFPAPRWTPQKAAYPAGRSTRQAVLQRPCPCPPKGVQQNPKSGIKAFKTELFTSKTIPYFHSQGSSWDEGQKTTMYSTKSWSVPASARLYPGRADTGRSSP